MKQEIPKTHKISIEEAAIYQIRIKGRITSSLIDAVDDMQIRQEIGEDIVSLIGWLPDQSALLGLLNTLNDIRHYILSVRILTNEQ